MSFRKKHSSYKAFIIFVGLFLLPFSMAFPQTTVSASTIIYGDVSGDGEVDSGDYTLMRKYLLEIIETMPAANWQVSGDLNGDGCVDSGDYMILRKYLLGTITSLPQFTPPKILIVSPHQDDETIACGGIIESAIKNGYDIRIMYVTNGDYPDYTNYGVLAANDLATELRDETKTYDVRKSAEKKAHVRLLEVFDAMPKLGLNDRDKIDYLSYDDGSLIDLYLQKENENSIQESLEKHTQTFGFPEKMDYHYIKYGVHADYTRKNILNDITSVINDFRPTDIYMPSAYENHADHKASGLFTIESILNIKKNIDHSYSPTLHQYFVYKYQLYSETNRNETPAPKEMKEGVTMEATSPYNWADREDIQVPADMLNTINSGNNKKYNTLLSFRSEYNGNTGWAVNYVSCNEPFWKKKMSSLSYNATVEASSTQTTQQYCLDKKYRNTKLSPLNVIDGVLLGNNIATHADDDTFPNGFDSNQENWNIGHEWAVAENDNEKWLKLSWNNSIQANCIVLNDRPDLNVNIKSARLDFYDEAGNISFSKYVDNLNPNGSDTRIYLDELKTFKALKLTILDCEHLKGDTSNPGLCKLEVYNTLQ